MNTGIYKEVSKFVTDKINAGCLVRVEWLASEIIKSKNHITGADILFYKACAQHYIQEVAKKCMGKYKPKPVSDEQLVLAGFEHLQKAYPIERGGEHLLIPIHQITNEELELRAVTYDVMESGCGAHAKEIRLFIRSRDAQQEAV